MTELAVYGSYDLTCSLDDVILVNTDKDGYLVEMSKKLTTFNSVYSGVFFIPQQHLNLLKETTSHILSKYDNNITTVEHLFPELQSRGERVKVVDIGKSNWYEMDTVAEYKLAKEAIENKVTL
jgi:choline kinase